MEAIRVASQSGGSRGKTTKNYHELHPLSPFQSFFIFREDGNLHDRYFTCEIAQNQCITSLAPGIKWNKPLKIKQFLCKIT
jgi:hypothetical protein